MSTDYFGLSRKEQKVNTPHTVKDNLRVVKTPAGFGIAYTLAEGKKVAAQYITALKSAAFYVDGELVANMSIQKEAWTHSGKAYAIVRKALNGILSLAGKKSRQSANRRKREAAGEAQ